MGLGLKKIVNRTKKLGHKIENKMELGKKKLHKFAGGVKKVGKFGMKAGDVVSAVGAGIGQPKLIEYGSKISDASLKFKRGAKMLEKKTA